MKKIILIIFIILSLLLSKSSVIAEENDFDPRETTQDNFLQGLDVQGVNLEKWSMYQATTTFPGALNCALGGVCSNNVKGVQTQKQTQYYNNSALGFVNNMMIAMYDNPPASTSYYAYDVLHNTGLIPKAYAQGIGFSGLTPILSIWKTFRNISYMILLVVLIVLGFMIMFRTKINPQTAITIQNSLPNIVITLLLITFSYVIAGFMIDLMYFLLMIVVNIFGQANAFPQDQVISLQEKYINSNTLTLIGSVFGLDQLLALPKALFGIPIITSVIGTVALPVALGSAFSLPIVALGFLVGGALPILIIVIALLFSFIRIFFILLNSYIQILIAIIFAPFQLLLGVIPGNNAFSSWIKGLIGNLIVFPATAVIFLIASTIARNVILFGGESLWSPPFIAGQSADSNILVGLIGLGITLIAPSLLNTIKGVFAPKPTLPIGTGAIFGPTVGLFNTLAQIPSLYFTFTGQHFADKFKLGKTTPSGEERPGVGQAAMQQAKKVMGGE